MAVLPERRRREIIMLATLACALFGVSCDGYLAVEGRVYRVPRGGARQDPCAVAAAARTEAFDSTSSTRLAGRYRLTIVPIGRTKKDGRSPGP
jgi:hypothetical protein